MRALLKFSATALVALLLSGAAWAQSYTNWPNGASGTTVGSIFLANVVTTPPTNYAAGQVQPTTQDTSGFLNIHCQIGCSASSDPANGPVAPGTAGTASKLTGGVFNTSAPTLTNGQQVATQMDSSGNTLVNVKVLPANTTFGSVGAGAAGTNSALAGGVFNSSPITLTNGQQSALQFDANGFLKINVSAGGASGGTSSTFGAAFPTLGTAIGFSQGGNMVAATGTSGNLNVNCASGCSAASDTSNGPVTPGVAATTSKLGGLVFNTSAPTLANTQQAALQGDSHANLLVNLNTQIPTGANVIGQVGGTTVIVTVTPTITAAAYSVGQCVGGLMTFAGAARSGGPGSALVQDAVITDVSGQDSAIDLILFNANPTSSTFTDHATCTVNNADLAKVIGTIHVTDCNLLGSSAPGTCQGLQQAIALPLGGGNTTAYAVAIARGTPTYTATNNIAVKLAFLED